MTCLKWEKKKSTVSSGKLIQVYAGVTLWKESLLYFLFLSLGNSDAQLMSFNPSHSMQIQNIDQTAAPMALVSFNHFCIFKALRQQGQGLAGCRVGGNTNSLCLVHSLIPTASWPAPLYSFLVVCKTIRLAACSCSNFFLTSFACSVNRPLVAHHWLLIAADIVWSLAA